jgi:hypothetical protein
MRRGKFLSAGLLRTLRIACGECYGNQQTERFSGLISHYFALSLKREPIPLIKISESIIVIINYIEESARKFCEIG